MDTLTHALVGTAISDGCFRKRLGPIATPFAFIVGALPDIDAATYLVSPEFAWANHRGYTHSFFVFLAAAPLLGYLGYRLSRKTGDWRQWMLLAFICLVAHTLFDLITSWGTMPLLPFSNARISWDIVPILDIFLTSVTGASFAVNRLLRWEKVQTFLNPMAYPIVYRHPRRQRAATIVARVCMVLVAVYLVVGWRQNRQTVRIATKELADAGIEAVEVRALPLLLTYVSWGIAAREADGTIHNAVFSSYAPKPMQFARFPRAKGLAVDNALKTPDGALFAWYSQNMYTAETERTSDGNLTRLRDRRFFTLSQAHLSRFIVEFRENADDRVTASSFHQMGFSGIDIREELRLLWELTSRGEIVPPPAAATAAR